MVKIEERQEHSTEAVHPNNKADLVAPTKRPDTTEDSKKEVVAIIENTVLDSREDQETTSVSLSQSSQKKKTPSRKNSAKARSKPQQQQPPQPYSNYPPRAYSRYPPPPPPPPYGYDPYGPPPPRGYGPPPPMPYGYPHQYAPPSYGYYPPPMHPPPPHSSFEGKNKKRGNDFLLSRNGSREESSSPRTANIFRHRRDFSGTSTASTLSVCEMSMTSFDGTKPHHDDHPLTRASPKRRRGANSKPISVDTTLAESESADRFQKLSVKESMDSRDVNLFLSLSTSPIDDVEATPSIKNTRKNPRLKVDRETPTPPLPLSSEKMTEEHVLNRHLRGQSFTPLPDWKESGVSPSYAGIQPQLSWSIADDTPSLGDLAEWERPASTTSQGSRVNNMSSPHSFTFIGKESESMLSPTSDGDTPVNGTTTPLPFFDDENTSVRRTMSNGEPEHIHKMFVESSKKHRHQQQQHQQQRWPEHQPSSKSPYRRPMAPPTPVYSEDRYGREGPPDYYSSYSMPPQMAGGDRVRNLRGRGGPSHHAPMPFNIPPSVPSHHNLTSPMGAPPSRSPWGPHHASPHHSHMPPPMVDSTQSKRKCVPLKPPIPSKFQGDTDKYKGAQVPEFTSLVNYPAHMSQKQSVNLPENMRCCVMCGGACACTNATLKGKTSGKKGESSQEARNENEKSSGFAIIPTQNKGLCTMCDVNVWVVCSSGLEIKWCKGCKNFRPWAAFGDKGLATKCLRCRERQREKYALQKEEKQRHTAPSEQVNYSE